MALQERKDFGSTSSLSSRGSLSNMLKDGVDNLEDSVTKKWLSWILRYVGLTLCVKGNVTYSCVRRIHCQFKSSTSRANYLRVYLKYGFQLSKYQNTNSRRCSEFVTCTIFGLLFTKEPVGC